MHDAAAEVVRAAADMDNVVNRIFFLVDGCFFVVVRYAEVAACPHAAGKIISFVFGCDHQVLQLFVRFFIFGVAHETALVPLFDPVVQPGNGFVDFPALGVRNFAVVFGQNGYAFVVLFRHFFLRYRSV